MGLFAGLLNVLSAGIVVVFVGRAVLKLLENPDRPHRELVSARERHATTIVGIPLTLVGFSTMVGGPLAVPYNALMILLPGIVLFAYPDFSPSGV